MAIRHVGPLLGIAEYFVLVTGSSARQVRSIAEEVDRRGRAEIRAAATPGRGRPSPGRPEGMAEGSWILLDFGDVVVHVFREEARRYYALDRLWGDTALVEFEVALPAQSATRA